MKKFKHQEKFLSVQDFESSDLFTAHEKAALRFAREVNDKKVTDANFHEIKKYFSEQEVISVAWMVMSENVYNIMNHAFAVESDGFCQIDPCCTQIDWLSLNFKSLNTRPKHRCEK